MAATAEPAPRAAAAVLPPRYRRLRELGRGAQGVVLAAYDDALDRPVALKLTRLNSELVRRRFRNEGRAIAALAHPNVLQIYDIHTDEGLGLLSTPLCQRSLSGTVLRWADAVAGFRDVARGLAAVHAAGLVHRDIKPSNIFVKPDNTFVIGDFGLVATPTLRSSRSSVYAVTTNTVTDDEAVLGTPVFMAPELFDGAVHNAMTDQYAFFGALFQVITGMLPVAPFHWPSGRAPKWLRAVVERGLSSDPAARFVSMKEAGDALARRTGPAYGLPAYGLIGVGAAMVGLAIWVTAPAPGLSSAADAGCNDAPAFTWSDADRDQIDAQVRGSGLASGGTVAAEINDALSSYAANTQVLLTGRCGAGAAPSAGSRSVQQCVARNAERVRAVAQGLAQAPLSPDAVMAVRIMVPELVSFEHCDRIGPGRDSDPGSDRADVAALVHGAFVADLLGRSSEPAELYRTLVRDPRVVGHPDLLAMTWVRFFRAEVGERSVERSEADGWFDAAAQAAAGGADPVVEAHVWNAWAGWTAHQFDLDRAAHLLSFSKAALTRGGGSQPGALQSNMVRARIAYERGQSDLAIEISEGVRQQAAVLGMRRLECTALNSLGNGLSLANRPAEVTDVASDAYQVCTVAYGLGHSNALAFAHGLARALLEEGRFEEAVLLFEANAPAAEGTINWGQWSEGLGRAYIGLGRLEAAPGPLTAALKFYKTRRDWVQVGIISDALGQVAQRSGQDSEACALYERARVAFESELLADHRLVIASHQRLASVRSHCEPLAQ